LSKPILTTLITYKTSKTLKVDLEIFENPKHIQELRKD